MIKYAIVFWLRTPRTYLLFMENYIWNINNSKYNSTKYNSVRQGRGRPWTLAHHFLVLSTYKKKYQILSFYYFRHMCYLRTLMPGLSMSICSLGAWVPGRQCPISPGERGCGVELHVSLCWQCILRTTVTNLLHPSFRKVAWNPPTRLLNSKTW